MYNIDKILIKLAKQRAELRIKNVPLLHLYVIVFLEEITKLTKCHYYFYIKTLYYLEENNFTYVYLLSLMCAKLPN